MRFFIKGKGSYQNYAERSKAPGRYGGYHVRCGRRRAGAPQVGILKRLIVIDAGDEHGLIKMINPEIVESEGEQFGPEGA